MLLSREERTFPKKRWRLRGKPLDSLSRSNLPEKRLIINIQPLLSLAFFLPQQHTYREHVYSSCPPLGLDRGKASCNLLTNYWVSVHYATSALPRLGSTIQMWEWNIMKAIWLQDYNVASSLEEFISQSPSHPSFWTWRDGNMINSCKCQHLVWLS